MPLAAEHKATVISASRRHDNDSGSPEVQVSILTERIRELSEHLKGAPKDFSSRRGLTQMVAKRNSLLKYLSRINHDAYAALIQRLGLRK